MSETVTTSAERAPRTNLRGAAVAAIGTALPEHVVTNAPIAARIGVGDGWIESRTGINTRRYASAGETLVGLATGAAAQALDRSGTAADEIDLVIVASFTQDD